MIESMDGQFIRLLEVIDQCSLGKRPDTSVHVSDDDTNIDDRYVYDAFVQGIKRIVVPAGNYDLIGHAVHFLSRLLPEKKYEDYTVHVACATPGPQFAARLISMMTKIPVTGLFTGEFSIEFWAAIGSALNKVHHRLFFMERDDAEAYCTAQHNTEKILFYGYPYAIATDFPGVIVQPGME